MNHLLRLWPLVLLVIGYIAGVAGLAGLASRHDVWAAVAVAGFGLCVGTFLLSRIVVEGDR